jgi:hypothetical protein
MNFFLLLFALFFSILKSNSQLKFQISDIDDLNEGLSITNTHVEAFVNKNILRALDSSDYYSATEKYKINAKVLSIIDSIKAIRNANLIPTNHDLILTNDTTICFGSSKQLLTKQTLNFSWSPVLYLDNPNSPNPTTSPPENITYYLTSQVTGENLIINGDFNAGNTGFTSDYQFSSSGIPPGVFFVGPNSNAWHPAMPACKDHTRGNGNMMLVNGTEQDGVKVWSQTIQVQPNTNYAFSTWLQHITTINPARLQFSINGVTIGNIFQANNTSCLWEQFYSIWNSGNNSTAVISIVNKNLLFSGNDFALDDISFAPVFDRKDSVTITVENPIVKTNSDTTFCEGTKVQLSASGAAFYSWSPSIALTNPNIANPIAAPVLSTQYIVTGSTITGCRAKDTIELKVLPRPIITLSNDTIICKNSFIQLFSSGGYPIRGFPY